MPVDKYFKGHGTAVLADMQARHGEKKGTRMFYATANKRGMAPTSKLPRGVKQTPEGDIGQHRQVEGMIAGGFRGPIVSASRAFKAMR